MDPLRKRFFVNGEPVSGSTLHAPYLKPANTLLNAMKQRMQLGGLQQLAQRYTTEDGAVLTAISRFGQDEIRIDVPFRQGGSVTHQEVPVIETPEFVRVLRVVGYTIWLVDETGAGVVEYDDAGQLTGRAFPELITPGSFDWITDVIYAHDALWVGLIDYPAAGNAAGKVLRINDRNGEISEVYTGTNGLSVALTAYSGGVAAVHDNSSGTPAVVVKMDAAGEIVAQGSGEYSTNVTAIFSDNENIYLTGGGGIFAGSWQSGGTYLRTLSLETLAGTTQSFVEANHPTSSGNLAAWDGSRLLMTGADELEGTYHDWAALGGTLAPIAGYGFDFLTITDPWAVCGSTLLKFHYSGDMEVVRGSVSPVTLAPYYLVMPTWDGESALWAVHYTADGVTNTLVRIGFDGSVASYPLPANSFAYRAPAIQLTKLEVTLPASEATETLPDDLAARELRIIRSRTGFT